MVEDAGNLQEHNADDGGASGDLKVQQLFHRHGVTVLRGHHGDVVEAVKVWQRLLVRLVLNELLSAAVKEPNVGVGAINHLAIELEDQPQHAVRRWVLGPKVEGEVLDLHLVIIDELALHLGQLISLPGEL